MGGEGTRRREAGVLIKGVGRGRGQRIPGGLTARPKSQKSLGPIGSIKRQVSGGRDDSSHRFRGRSQRFDCC